MTDLLKRFGLADEIAQCFKRSPFGFQKGSFCCSKGVLLQSKRGPFAMQNESFWKTCEIKVLQMTDSLAVNVYFFLPGGVFRLLK